MKTKKMNIVASTVRIVMLVVAVLTAGCNNKETAAQTTADAAGKSTVSAPSVDLHTAVITENMDALKQHIQAGSNLNEKDPFGGSSPLISACLFGKTEMAKVLIDAGADLNFKNNDGSTPLHVAAFFCRPEIVKVLVARGADKTIKNKYNATAYESVAGPFADVKPTYEMMGKVLAPMGLTLDFAYIEKTRPQVASMLK